jgi:hypothetical protein
LRQHPAQHVATVSRGEGDHDAHRPGRIVLRERDVSKKGREDGQRLKQPVMAGKGHTCLLFGHRVRTIAALPRTPVFEDARTSLT